MIPQLLFLIDTAYDHVSWHGTNLRGSIRGVSPGEAAWRPAPNRHNIHELVVHAAYWKYVARRRLTGEKRGSFPLEGSNWFGRSPRENARAWKADIALLDETHRALREVVAALGPGDLQKAPAGSKVKNLALVTGIAAHDFYHAGQIQLLKRLMRTSPRAASVPGRSTRRSGRT